MATEAARSTARAAIPGPRVAPNPDIRPRAGHSLLVGVDKVLARLPEPGDTVGLADDLRTALARTAAL
ncbi:MAG: hypothetical protein LC635_03770, partial [Pseudonocardiaceae bacterium]|nr:hypothetical protein [Pseudonocardiaceae bacterium]